MKSTDRLPLFKDQDELRLLALSRIPRCAACSRLRALRAIHEDGVPLEAPLPPSTNNCDAPYCAPLAARYATEERREAAGTKAGGGSGRQSGATAFAAAAPVFENV